MYRPFSCVAGEVLHQHGDGGLRGAFKDCPPAAAPGGVEGVADERQAARGGAEPARQSGAQDGHTAHAVGLPQ